MDIPFIGESAGEGWPVLVSAYIEIRRQTILNCIVNRPIFQLRKDTFRLYSTSNHQYWWEQPMNLEMARALLVDLDMEDVTGS